LIIMHVTMLLFIILSQEVGRKEIFPSALFRPAFSKHCGRMEAECWLKIFRKFWWKNVSGGHEIFGNCTV
jgi:hypothetical protein